MTAEQTASSLRDLPDHGPWIAAVFAHDSVRFVTAAPTRHELVLRLAAYVADNARLQLWPADALRVRILLRAGELDAAVALYFECVGERWDEERLVTAGVEAGAEQLARSA